MKAWLKPVARDQRPAGLAAQRQRLAHHRRRQRRRAFARIDVQRREQHRTRAAGRRARPSNRARRRPRRRPPPGAGARPQIVERRRCPARGGSCRKSTTAEPSLMRSVQRSPDCEIDERKVRRRGPHQRVARCRSPRRTPAPHDCPTAPDGCRCRWSCRWCGRSTSGSARRDRRSPRARRPSPASAPASPPLQVRQDLHR